MDYTFHTSDDIRNMVTQTLEAGHGADDFDVEAIVADIIQEAEYNGRQFILDDVDIWEIISRHDVSQTA